MDLHGLLMKNRVEEHANNLSVGITEHGGAKRWNGGQYERPIRFQVLHRHSSRYLLPGKRWCEKPMGTG